MKQFLSKHRGTLVRTMIALIVSAVLIAIYVNVPMYRIASGSMEPTLPIGRAHV